MSSIISNSKQAETEKRKGLREKVIPLLTLLLVIAITVVIFLFFQRYPEKVKEFENYGYLGAFMISLIGNATILLLPAAVLPMLSAIGVILYPVTGPIGPILVGLAGGAGAGIGEISGYMVGYSGRGVVRNNRTLFSMRSTSTWMRFRIINSSFLFRSAFVLEREFS